MSRATWRGPNASYFSARYAERKRAAERAQMVASGPIPCNRCSATQAMGSIFCEAHGAEYEALLEKCVRGEMDVKDVLKFTERVYWPPSGEPLRS